MPANMDNISASVPRVPGQASLIDLLVELRLDIWRHLLELNDTDLGYSYTSFPYKSRDSSTRNTELQHYQFQLMLLEQQSRRTFLRATREMHKGNSNSWLQAEFQFGSPLPVGPAQVRRTHSMILVSKQLGAEYRQMYYERTNFEFHIDSKNVLQGIPTLAEKNRPGDVPACLFPTPNFWGAPIALFENLRQCSLYILLRSMELPMYSDPLQKEDLILDAYLDSSVTQNVLALIASMRQIRKVFVGWVTYRDDRLPVTIAKALNLDPNSGSKRPTHDGYLVPSLKSGSCVSEYTKAAADYNWNMFIRQFALALMEKSTLREFELNIDLMRFTSYLDSHGKWFPPEADLETSGYWARKKELGELNLA